jgi:hypothetical protein
MQRKNGITFLFRLLQQQQLRLEFSFVCIQLKENEIERVCVVCDNHNSLQKNIYIDLFSLCVHKQFTGKPLERANERKYSISSCYLCSLLKQQKMTFSFSICNRRRSCLLVKLLGEKID